MGFVDDYHRILRQKKVLLNLPQKHSISHEFHFCILSHIALVPDLIRYLGGGQVELMRHPVSHCSGRHPTRLGHPNHSALTGITGFEEELRQLRCLSTTSLAREDSHLVLPDRLHDDLLLADNGQASSGFLHARRAVDNNSFETHGQAAVWFDY